MALCGYREADLHLCFAYANCWFSHEAVQLFVGDASGSQRNGEGNDPSHSATQPGPTLQEEAPPRGCANLTRRGSWWDREWEKHTRDEGRLASSQGTEMAYT